MHVMQGIMLATAVALGLATYPQQAAAGGQSEARKQVESTKLVRGVIDIDATGKMLAYTLNPADELEPDLAAMVARVAPQWRFEPFLVDGKPANVRADMTLRFVAKQAAEGKYSVSLGAATFGKQSAPGVAAADRPMAVDKRARPRYPEGALRAGVGGEVIVALHFDRSGKVLDADAQQVNLRAIGRENEMRLLRDMFAREAVRVLRQWTFKIPAGTAGDAMGYIVVNFCLHGDANCADTRDYGVWRSYVPGPRNVPVWMGKNGARMAGDAISGSQLLPASDLLELKTPLSGAG